MEPYTLPLSDPRADLETVGGKGMSLAKLITAGFPVPDGFHVTTTAYRRFIEHNHLQAGILAALETIDLARPETLEAAAEAIERLFTSAALPAELENAITTAYKNLPGPQPAVAVRSSATAEDLPGASFAGQQETYLNLRGVEGVLAATRKCWASLWTARAIAYRSRQGIPSERVALAVVVQRLVDAEAAGVMFTVNPLNGKRDELVINAAWGLGEAVVGGLVTPDVITFSKPASRPVRRETAEKTIMTACTADGTEAQPVPNSLKNKAVLSDEQAAGLARLGLQIEALYGVPVDVEWTLAAGEFAIVQARPVTALPAAPIEWAPPNPKGIYMRASVADLMPEPLSPLFVTLGIPALVKQMYPLGNRMTRVTPRLAEDYFTCVNNYAYMNAAIPPKAWWWILTGLLPSYPGLLRGLSKVWREELLPEYRALVASKGGKAPSQMTAEELWRDAHGLVDAAAYYICGLMFATMGASAGSEGLLTMVYNRLAKQAGDPDASVLLMGWDNIPIRAEKSLYDLAMWVREDESLTDYILITPAHDLAAALESPGTAQAPAFSAFRSRFQDHLTAFGYVVFQLDFAAPLPRDHAEPMLESIKMYLRGEGSNPYERQQASQDLRLRTAERMRTRLRGLKRWAFQKALDWGQSLAEVREDALAEIGLAYPKLRGLLHELGNRLVKAGAIQQADDVYWLEKDEVSTCVARLDQNQAVEELADRVAARKAFNQRASQVAPPPIMPLKKRVMGIKTDSFLALSEDAQAGNVLKGVGASAGIVTAPACVLHGSQDFDQMHPGDVLVAGATTPAWTPLFAMACAVVTDIGGPLSHGSIVAREYGIPAVMGTGVATRRIRSGQMVTVDGAAGTVTLEDA